MRDYLDLGCAPADEDCAQVGSPDYFERARRQCRAFIGLLRRTLGEEPAGARLTIRSNPHDFGTYLSVACHYDCDDREAADYAYRCEREAPAAWDDQARRELDGSQDGRKETTP